MKNCPNTDGMATAKKVRCLILTWLEMPKPIRDRISGWCGFHNDCLLPIRSEFDVASYRQGMKSLEEYWKDQCDTNGFKGDLQKFIEDYGLEFDEWFIQQNFDLKGVTRILVEVSW